jgi:hypothetical protein
MFPGLIKDPQRASSPSKFSSEASDSPSKLNVPRKLRNQQSNQVGNIEFAVEINTSLIAQVRQLQAVVSERDEALKVANLERSRLEAEVEGFAQRLKSMDESEQRYKDENWNLETQIHEMIASAKEAASREQKLQQLLAVTTAEKSAAERDLDDLKQNHVRLTEDFAVIRKNHEVELAALRKNVQVGETEKIALKRKVEELTTQNQEFAKALSVRFRDAEVEAGKDADSEPEDPPIDHSEPEHSPPPSPTKGAPRHAMLESETLKSSLHHAHRMIQNLKGSIHREKSEKSDLKRMLQEARDELEVRKKDPGSMSTENKKSRLKAQQELQRKVRPTMLGAGRESQVNIIADDAEWEEQDGEHGPDRDDGVTTVRQANGAGFGHTTDMSDVYQTADETEDSFETANELESATENEGFPPGVKESFVESSDELTETEQGPTRSKTIRGERPSVLITGKPGNRLSYQSTASTSGDDDEQSVTTPVQQPPKYRLKIHRGPRRSRMSSDIMESSTSPSAKNSPSSFIGGGNQEGQSLFAELGDINGGESGEDVDGTPTKASTPLNHSTSSMNRSFSRNQSATTLATSNQSTVDLGPSSEGTGTPPIPRLPLVDSATMTDPCEPIEGSQGQPESNDKRPDVYSDDDPFASRPSNTDRGLLSVQNQGIPKSSTASGIPAILKQPLGMLSNILSSSGDASQATSDTDKPPSPDVNGPEESGRPSYDAQTHQKPYENNQDLEKLGTNHQRRTVDTSTSTVNVPHALSISSIQTLEITPSITSHVGPNRDSRKETPSPVVSAGVSEANSTLPLKPDVERIITTIFGSDKYDIPLTPSLTETETGREVPPVPKRDGRRSSGESLFYMNGQPNSDKIQYTDKHRHVDVADHSSQTLLSSEQIDRILWLNDRALATNSQKAISVPTMKPLSDIGAAFPSSSSQPSLDSKDVHQGKQAEQPTTDLVTSAKVPRRPLSSSSMRSRSIQYPPLPPDHQQAIAAAAQKAPSIEPSAGSMGPPLAPASAYRSSLTRPRTPSRSRSQSQQQIQSPLSKSGTTPRARHSTSKSRMSRRSSVSSFASELDERFNIRVDDLPYGLQSGTDPRMIQAITQTMIGEFLWKYTRKAGRGDMSSNRHRRFFWVHPYTRTLYWSSKDPAIAGRAELKAKSVGIEAVQVVIDDNPMPPGLHRKSLVIFTPGRCIKLTATTGQRHETWFNALSYLLLRTGVEGTASAADGTNISAEDVEDFSPSLNRRASRATGSRISLASFRNNASQRSLNQQAQTNLEVRQSHNPSRAAHSSVTSRHSHQRHPYQGSASSRWSQYLRHGASGRGSVSSRVSHSVPPQERVSSQYTNMAHDSAEDLRQVIEQQEREADQLENVRACCDGWSSLRFRPLSSLSPPFLPNL